MCENWTSIPHVTQFEEADITHLLDLRRRFAPQYEAKGARLTLTPIVIRALVSTLKKHPLFNASIDDVLEEVVLKHYYHVGVAVDTEAGLIVPVIRDADRKSLLQVSKELEELAAKARDRKVSGEELKGGTFTVSNQGGIGGGFFTPIINKPEVAILGLGRGTQKPAVVGGNVEIRTLLPIALSYDHRLIDGGSAARFIVEFVQNLTTINDNDLNIVS
jgi:pyruvate dehydrogenase E2 component (dihydrolipoamide acetyltransferase)